MLARKGHEYAKGESVWRARLRPVGSHKKEENGWLHSLAAKRNQRKPGWWIRNNPIHPGRLHVQNETVSERNNLLPAAGRDDLFLDTYPDIGFFSDVDGKGVANPRFEVVQVFGLG